MSRTGFRFPTYIQHDIMDCGPACLKIIAKYFGKTFSMKYLRDLCYITREGVSLFDIGRAAEEIGLRTLAIKVAFDDLEKKMPLPLIVHWKQSHFVVVYKISKRKVFISDPAYGLIDYSHLEYRASWEQENGLGAILILETTPEFNNRLNNETSGSFVHFLKYMLPYQKYLLQVLLGMIAGILIGVLTPFISQSIVDFGIGTGNIKFVNVMLVAGLVLAVSSLISNFIQSRLMLFVSERVNMSMVSDFLRKSIQLPIAFFERKMVSDLLIRIGDHERIQAFIMNTLLGVVVNLLLILVYSLIMLYYEVNMFLVFLFINVLYLGWILLFLNRRRKLDNLLFESRTSNSNDLLELLENINEIKVNNLGNSRRWKWELSRYKIYGVRVKSLNLNQMEETGAMFLLRLQNIFITYIAASNVINGSMTLGMMMAAQYIVGQLTGPIQNMIGYVHSLQYARLSLKRVNEIILDEEPESSGTTSFVPKHKTIIVKNLSFRYNPNFNKVLDNINIEIPEGKVTAIVGESGSGKTTLLKLLLRFYPPSDGHISVGGIPLEDIKLRTWRLRCGTILQDGRLFNDTVLYNITLEENEQDVDKHRLLEAISFANLNEFIQERPLKLYTPLGTNGSGISQGQKQRILFARAVYKDPDFIFLDEATNSLDANNEKLISENLERFLTGKTAVVIAHRLSTIKSADKIVVLDKGKVVEEGTHEELLEKNGMYFRLIVNQLPVSTL
ncbi:MAG TPA: peptidase domain-containing ABC transporter [Cyclobacteriaceae bacterium]|nr:peptidase domain-containing ABC transporter [Cyclobacteriaceae bacterium]